MVLLLSFPPFFGWLRCFWHRPFSLWRPWRNIGWSRLVLQVILWRQVHLRILSLARPGFNFFFFFFSRSVTNRRPGSKAHPSGAMRLRPHCGMNTCRAISEVLVVESLPHGFLDLQTIEAKTPFALDPHEKMLNGTGRSASLTSDQFTSEHLWVNLSRIMIYDLLHSTGQDLQLPRGKGHKRTSRSHTKVPHLIHLQQQTRNQFCEWPRSNNEHWKSVVLKFFSVSQVFLFNADRINYNVEWYWLWTKIQRKLHWYCRLTDCNRGCQYCTSLQIAFESLLSQNYTNFVLTVGYIGVSIYCNVDIGFKIFDSHARDMYGWAHPQDTCVLLEAWSPDSFVCYF